jgi:anti-sigma factor RsiW
MTSPEHQAPDGPSHEELMAFADGELQPARRDEVAAWLEHHPDGRAEVEEVQRLTALWRRHLPPEPAPAAWTAALARIETADPFRPPVSPWRGRRATWTYTGLAAAAVLGAVMLGRSLWVNPGGPLPEEGTSQPVAAAEEPFPVALASEITIVSMELKDARDVDSLVGHPPVLANMEVAGRDDVQLLDAAWHDGRKAQMRDEGEVPMIVASASEDR